MLRRKRTQPSARCIVQITARDADVMAAVAANNYMSAQQIARDAFPSEDRCRRRLRQLLDARYIAATLVSSQAPNLVSITRDGLAALADRGVDISAWRPPAPIRSSAVPHHLLGVDARMYAAGLIVEGLGRLATWEAGKGETARALGLCAAHIAPDFIAFVEIRGQSGVVVGELDCGHEGTALIEKLHKYWRWLPHQQATRLWLIADGDDARVRQVCRMCAGFEKWVRIMRPADLRRRPIVKTPGELNLLAGQGTSGGRT